MSGAMWAVDWGMWRGGRGLSDTHNRTAVLPEKVL